MEPRNALVFGLVLGALATVELAVTTNLLSALLADADRLAGPIVVRRAADLMDERREALAVDSAIGAETIFAPYKDGELPDDEQVRLYVANVIRQVKPTYVFTHWQKSIHKDHSRTSAIVQDAVLLASLEGVVTGTPPSRGLRGIWYADNWEDADDFQPYIYVDVSSEMQEWRDAVSKYEFIRGGISSFRYLDYYDALSIVRGAVVGKQRALAFNIDAFGKRRVLDALP